MTSSAGAVKRVAILYQALDPPLINGVRKPKKPSGYKDSGADIAYVFKHGGEVEVVTPSASPDPASDEDWCFPDTEAGIADAVGRRATHLWANTIVFAQHPLQTSPGLEAVADELRVVGQPPRLVDLYDDKDVVNEMLRSKGFGLPRAQLVRDPAELEQAAMLTHLARGPLVAKPASCSRRGPPLSSRSTSPARRPP
ncbi:uncharacterized protein PV09_05365 [Verruconis gallopava]|uniref:ATP-grasp domain-containing protein n=1 Tax=Verruconis gallopava TaxID=253628 RepID=A0A0D1YSL5_9PEZI|nr:uncharacterized protein PV09_05365 [Verruconis gallopava]KIW03612.1 hypothetical protein PV09_05365 [Verruconis gallopava]